jgi:hypothetical protein
MGVVGAPLASVRFSVATVPFEMIVELTPYNTHAREPLAAAQLNVFPAAVEAEPALAEIEITLALG